MNALFSQLALIPTLRGKILRLDFSSISCLSVFEINELYFYILNHFSFDDFEIHGNNQIIKTLEEIDFFYFLEKSVGINRRKPYVRDDSMALYKLNQFNFKAQFESRSSDMFSMFENIGLKMETASLLVGSLAEVADNAFGHNLGKWPSQYGPLVICLIQQDRDNRVIEISLLDFGVGFEETLKGNYPEIKNEETALRIALQPNTTGRLARKGGNGLYFLQKNIFNGFTGSLQIRSRDTLVNVISLGVQDTISKEMPFSFGANVGFKIRY